MRTLSSEDLLTVWERGRAEARTVQRALAMLSASYPGVSFASLVALPVGERDSLLLALRNQLFGSTMEARMTCPSCGEELQIDFNLADLDVDSSPARGDCLKLNAYDYDIKFRLPNSLDLLAIHDVEGLEEKRSRLLGRLVIRSSCRGQDIPYLDLPEHLVAELEHAMQEADPQADVRLNLRCDACGRACQSLFDIVSFLWKELDAWAIGLLRDVHTLARGYGWREADILCMRPWRRQCYLEMLGA
jgi:hypothetical protein